MERKIVGALIGLAVGWLAEEAAKEILADLGVPPGPARVVGAVIGAAVA
jgi:hypothetical protein